MPDLIEIDARLARLEAAVAELARRLNGTPSAKSPLERITGKVRDLEAFEKVLEYGREIRNADRPLDQVSEAP